MAALETRRGWKRVSKRRPCPVCERPDWCLYAGAESNPTVVICARVESGKRCGESGWLHRLRDDGYQYQTRRRVVRQRPGSAFDFKKMAAECEAAVQLQDLASFADRLGLSVGSLRRLEVGWSVRHGAWTFPMQNAAGNIVGVRLRLPDGRKLSVKGGREGIFMPANLDTAGRLVIDEGPTDTAAMLDLGFAAVGRPSCTGGVRLIVELVQSLQPDGVVIFADADPPGLRGARHLASVVAAYARSVKVVTPPPGVNDARQWKQQGATRNDVLARIAETEPHRLRLFVVEKVGKR